MNAKILSALFFFFLFSPVCFAHEGHAQEKKVEGFLFAVESEPEQRVAGKTSTLLMQITDSNGMGITANAVWVRIARDQEIVFASNNFSLDGELPIALLYVFPETGEYELTIGVEQAGKMILATFPLVVIAETKPVDYTPLLFSLGVLALGIASGYALSRLS